MNDTNEKLIQMIRAAENLLDCMEYYAAWNCEQEMEDAIREMKDIILIAKDGLVI